MTLLRLGFQVDTVLRHPAGGNAMESFLARHRSQIQGTISGFDRLRFVGQMRMLSFAEGLAGFLSRAGVLLKDFGEYVENLSTQSLSGKLRRLISHILEWNWHSCLVGRQSPHDPANGTDLDPSFTRLRASLIVLAMPPIVAQPGKAPFRYPTLRQFDVSDRALGMLHHLDRERLLRSLQPRSEGVVPVLPIAPDGVQPGEPLPVQLPEHLRRRRPVVSR